MKKHYSLILLLFASLLVGCGDSFLDKPPYGSLNDQNFFKTEDDIAKALTACYSWLGQGDEFEVNKFEFGDVASDDSYKGGESDNDRPFSADVAFFRAVSNNQLCENFWRLNYRGIYKCNQVIEKAALVAFANEELKTRYISEARFLRAYYYLNLVRVYGGVPLLTKPTVFPEEDGLIPRATEEDLHQFLRTEYNEMAADLPEKASMNMSKDWGRASRGAAYGMLARMELYFGSYKEAREAAKKVIESGQYGLEPQFGNLFFNPRLISEESIFEVLHADTEGKGDDTIIATYCRSRGCGGWGFNCPSKDLVSEFEVGDPRLLYTITESGDIFPRKDGSKEIQNNTGYTSGDGGYHSRKVFIPETRRSDTRSEMEMNFMLLRYADVLLMYAEAVLEDGGDLGEACKYINMVRERARNTSKYDPEAFGDTPEEKTASRITKVSTVSIPDIKPTSRDVVRDALRKERRVELAMENHRFYDLKRWGVEYAKSRIEKARKFSIPGDYANKLKAFPIPQRDIDRSRGIVTQNPGW